MMSTNTACFFICLFIGLLSSCRAESEKLTRAELQQVDTLYNNHIEKMAPDLDSLCELTQDSLIQLAADSMIKIRIEEMEKLLNRQ